MNPTHTLILEASSLELVPKRFQSHKSCKTVYGRYGTPPRDQLLDANFHHEILKTMNDNQKRGRPDVVHFAILDVTSTPLFTRGLIQVIIHTINNRTIRLKPGVRIPRTMIRFSGVMAKLLREEPEENPLFEIDEKQNISDLISSLAIDELILLSHTGLKRDLRKLIEEGNYIKKNMVWIVGGFPHGHFSEELLAKANDVISISNQSLPAHVVVARLCYDLERKMTGMVD